MEQPTSRKKRARTNSSANEDDKKRGRPRVEKEDESAADRRRTQIRMAQRAYRQRKESTLEELRKRVSDLTSTIELMNKTFVECRDRLYVANLPAAHMLDLETVGQQFDNLVKAARNPAEASDPEPAKADSGIPAISRTETRVENLVEPQNVPSWLDQSALTTTNKPRMGPMDVGMGYTMYIPENGDSLQNGVQRFSGGPQISMSTDPLPQAFQSDSLNEMRAEIPASLTVTQQPRPPMTYSFQETTFARRLHRACAEMAYSLMSDPRTKPAEYERIFRLSLLGRNRDKITASLKAILDRGPHEDLDVWESPLIHVGGAGTHYPRRDPFGNLLPKKTSYNVGIVGPQTLSLLENAAKDNISADMTVEIAGFEGEWFDPSDVQGYLEEKGIFIDPTSSFAEAEITEWPDGGSPDSSYKSSTGMPEVTSNHEKSTPLTTSQVNKLITEADVDFSQWDDSANMTLTAVGYSDAQNGSMNFIQPGESIRGFGVQTNGWDTYGANDLADSSFGGSLPNSHPSTPQPRRRNILIDVSKLVKVLVITGVCLGRTPGFRRRDIDRALAISSFNAF